MSTFHSNERTARVAVAHLLFIVPLNVISQGKKEVPWQSSTEEVSQPVDRH